MPYRSIEAIDVSVRVYLYSIVVLCCWQSMVSPPLALSHPYRPVPWLLIATVGTIWIVFYDRLTIVKLMTIFMTIGFLMRSVEIVVYSERDFPTRLGAAGYWIMSAVVACIFGFLNLTVIVGRQAKGPASG